MSITRPQQNGSSSIMTIFFVSIFSMLAVSFTTMSQTSLQTSANHQNAIQAQAAAESGINYACALVANYTPPAAMRTAYNTVSADEATAAFGYFRTYVDNLLGSANNSWNNTTNTYAVPTTGVLTIDNEISSGFSLQFTLETETADHPHQIVITSTGKRGEIEKRVQMALTVQKDGTVLEYAIASRGRMIITGDTTIDGDIYSAWPRADYNAPFATTSETVVNGTLNTLLTYEDLAENDIYMESLDGDGNPLYNAYDTVQGQYGGINYGVIEEVPGMDISEYNTSMYTSLVSNMSSSSTITTEYFPHVAGYYNRASSSSSAKLSRRTYADATFTNIRCPAGYNALFKRCTFNGILYINSTSSYPNNIRFEDCVFNGPIITAVPSTFNWIRNTLYFTGTATFNNTYMEEATILAPYFNVNLGNTAEVEAGSGSTLTGAIVGGIVDVRGNAQIDGTIISMFDTSAYREGYVTNIGFANDGGSESSALDPEDDVGVIRITPDPSRLLPSGMVTPIIFTANADSYAELTAY